MKRFMTILCAALVSGAALSAQETADTSKTETTDTLVIIVRHEKAGGFFERTGKPFRKGYKAVENAFTNGYQAVEDAFVQPFTDTVSTSRMYRKHYRADIGLSWTNPNIWGITSSHGYSFGNGLYVGGGFGFAAEMSKSTTYLVPVFADVKYSFINKLASPFVSLRAGSYADITNTGLRAFVNPAVGIDISRFSINVGYEYQVGFWKYGLGEDSHRIRLGVGFTF
ncbi:MAG: hypothetical protein IJ394_01010 [Bacteroidales bacterium]|nr:hypothetical protein [Bacteroidales bacterium]